MRIHDGRMIMGLPAFRESGASGISLQQEHDVLHSLQELVDHHAPDCVLLAGDLVDDVFAPRDLCWRKLFEFLAFLRRHRIPALAVRGNKDDARNYEAACRLPGVRDISEQLVKFKGIRILGVSHAATKNLRYMRRIAQKHGGRIDIVLAHAEFSRRPWLMLLATQMVVTGHFDTQLSRISDKALISMWSSPSQYAAIDTEGKDWRVSLFTAMPPDERLYARDDRATCKVRPPLFKAVALKRGGRLRFLPQPSIYRSLLFRRSYAKEISALMKARSRVALGSTAREIEERKLTEMGISKNVIGEFLSRA
jgi:hypothetical protein